MDDVAARLNEGLARINRFTGINDTAISTALYRALVLKARLLTRDEFWRSDPKELWWTLEHTDSRRGPKRGSEPDKTAWHEITFRLLNSGEVKTGRGAVIAISEAIVRELNLHNYSLGNNSAIEKAVREHIVEWKRENPGNSRK